MALRSDQATHLRFNIGVSENLTNLHVRKSEKLFAFSFRLASNIVSQKANDAITAIKIAINKMV